MGTPAAANETLDRFNPAVRKARAAGARAAEWPRGSQLTFELYADWTGQEYSWGEPVDYYCNNCGVQRVPPDGPSTCEECAPPVSYYLRRKRRGMYLSGGCV